MDMDGLKVFEQEVEAFLARTSMSQSRFGQLACHDRAFVTDLRRGREPKPSTVTKVREFMREHESATKKSLPEASSPRAA